MDDIGEDCRVSGMCTGPQRTIHNNLLQMHVLVLFKFDSKYDGWSYYGRLLST
jgi:hypothetical protein